MRKLGAFTITIAVVLGSAAAASARQQQDEIHIPIDTVVRGVADGEVVELVSVPVRTELVGSVCTATATSSNNEGSVHPGNDLVVTTDGSSEVLVDVEREPGAVTTISDELVLGTDLVVSLRMGPDGTFSGGIDVVFDCALPPPPTTTPDRTTTVPPSTVPPTTTPPTTAPPTTTTPDTTTSAPPQATTTSPPPPTAPAEDTTTTVPPLGSTVAPPDTTGEQLPATGPRAVDVWVVAAGVVLLGAGVGAVGWERRRRPGS